MTIKHRNLCTSLSSPLLNIDETEGTVTISNGIKILSQDLNGLGGLTSWCYNSSACTPANGWVVYAREITTDITLYIYHDLIWQKTYELPPAWGFATDECACRAIRYNGSDTVDFRWWPEGTTRNPQSVTMSNGIDWKMAIGATNSSGSYRATGDSSWIAIATSGGTYGSYAGNTFFPSAKVTYGGAAGPVARDSGTTKEIVITDDGTFTPPVCTTLAATAISQTQIDLTWSDGSNTSTTTDNLSLERSTTGGGADFSEIATPAVGDQSYSDTTCLAGTTYYYRIRSKVTALGTAYYSAYTSEANAATLAAGSPSQDLLALGEL